MPFYAPNAGTHLVKTKVPSYTKGWRDLAGSGAGVGDRSQNSESVERELTGCPVGHWGPVRSICLCKHRQSFKDMCSLRWKTTWTQQRRGHGVCGCGSALPVQGGREAGLAGVVREVDRDALPETRVVRKQLALPCSREGMGVCRQDSDELVLPAADTCKVGLSCPKEVYTNHQSQ